MTRARPFRPSLALEVLTRHGVRFVLIGGIGARLHGSPSVTNDLDICYARDDENLQRLATALHELRVRLRGAPPDVPFQLDAGSLKAGDHFTFIGDAGALDCIGTPAGTSGYEDLARTAERLDIDGAVVLVASIEDLIRMKLAAGRPKDRIEAEILGALLEEIEGGPR